MYIQAVFLEVCIIYAFLQVWPGRLNECKNNPKRSNPVIFKNQHIVWKKKKKILVDANTGGNKRCCHLFRHSISWKTPVVIFLQGLTFFLLFCMVVQCLVNGWRKLRRNVVVECGVFFFSFRSCARVHPVFIAEPQPVSWLGLSCDERISLDGEIKLCGIEMGHNLCCLHPSR